METNKSDFLVIDYVSKNLVKNIDVSSLKVFTPAERMEKINRVLREIVEKDRIMISESEIEGMAKEIYEYTFEFGPISFLVSDDEVTEIMINKFNDIYIEKDGVITKSEVKFRDDGHIKNLVEKILSPLGLRVDESSPMVDARLSDGSRINVVLSPISLNDIVVTIRKFKKTLMNMDDLIEIGTLNEETANFIKVCVQSKINTIISGATATGKTTFLNVISNFIPRDERIITIEDTLELNLKLPHVVKLESRPPNLEGKGQITIRDLVRNSLRMRPDRIIVGEIRGEEAVDVLQAMNTGHSGSMSTVHANSPDDLISRLETMLLMAGLNLNPSSARRMIASSIDMVIHLRRLQNGQRLLAQVSEIINASESIGSNTIIEVKDIFSFQNENLGKGSNYRTGKCETNRYKKDNSYYKQGEGCHKFTGYIPVFIKMIRDRGLEFDFKC